MFYIKYLGALLYDLFIISTLLFTFTAICLWVRGGLGINPHTLWYQLSLLFILYAYYGISYPFGGQTIGMRAWGIKLVAWKGNLSQQQLVWRFGVFIPALIYALLRLKNPRSALEQWTHTRLILDECL